MKAIYYSATAGKKMKKKHIAFLNHLKRKNIYSLLIIFTFLLIITDVLAQPQSVIYTSNSTFTVPAGVTEITVECWGGGGGGGGSNSTLGTRYGGGGGGGGFSAATYNVSSGQTYTITIGAGGTSGSNADGGNGGTTTFSGTAGTLNAGGGGGGKRYQGTPQAGGGSAGIGNTYNGGIGGTGTGNGAGGGGGAGNNGNGTNGGNSATGQGGTGNPDIVPYRGGNGGAYRNSNGDGNPGLAPGGGGGGGRSYLGNRPGGNGAPGQVIISYCVPPTNVSAGSPVTICNGQSTQLSGSASVANTSSSSAVYSAGSGSTEYNTAPTTATNSSCPINLSVTIPAGAVISSVNVSYNMTTASDGWMSEQRSYLECTSSGGTKESAISSGVGAAGGTYSYNRTGLTIANGVTSGGTINFRLHSFRTYGGSGCNATYNYVANNTFTVTVNYLIPISYSWSGGPFVSGQNTATPTVNPTTTTTYTMTASVGGCTATSSVTVTVNEPPSAPTGITGNTNICDGQSTTLTIAGGSNGSGATVQWFEGSCGSTVIGTGNSINVSPASNTTYYVRRVGNSPCDGTVTSCASTTVTVLPNMLAGSPSSTPTVCVNDAMTAITHSTTGAIGIGTASGLPPGVSAAWGSNTITISGTPNTDGTYNYSIPLTGGCGTASATGTITVLPVMAAGSPSSTPTLCINTTLTAITHSTTGATGIGTATGLPTGVSAAWGSNAITINGTPTNSGTFNYSIPLTGGCGTVNATGTIIVNPDMIAGAASSSPTLCMNSTLSQDITHSTTNATGIGSPSGLPAGMNAAWASNTITISGTPAASGTFNYSIPLSGGCGTANATGTITVNDVPAAVTVIGGGSGFCGSTLLEASGGTGGTVYWQNTTYNGTSTATASTQQYVTAGNTYYFRAYDGSCWGDQGSATVSIESPSTSGLATGDYVWGGAIDSDWTKQSNWLRRTGTGFEVPTVLPSNSDNVFVRSYGGGSCPQQYPLLESVNVIELGSITVGTGAQIDVAPGSGLTVFTQIDNDGIFTLRSDVTGTATLITDAVYSSGQFNMQQYLVGSAGSDNQPNGRMYYLASPVAGGTANTFAPFMMV
jgi:hypothetical protein